MKALRSCCEPRPIKRTRFGLAEDPRGQIVVCSGRLYTVTDVYRRESPAAYMLKVKHFDGSDAGELAAGACKIVPGHFHDDDSYLA